MEKRTWESYTWMENNTRINTDVDWIILARDIDQSQDLENMLINFRVS